MNKKLSKQQTKQLLLHAVLDSIYFALGGTLYAISVNVFTAPNDILPGGFTGVATIFNRLFATPIGTVVFLLNIPLFLAGFKKFGFAFVIKTVSATFFMSALIDLLAPVLPVYRGDRLLSALFGGILSGAGLGVVFRRGATTGGTDIISKLLRLRFPAASMGRMVLVLDLLVIAASFAVYRSLENVLYALVVIYVSAQTIDLVQTGLSHDKLLFIVTEKGASAVREIVETLDRGVSVLDVRGGYTGTERKLLLCAVRASDVARVTKAVRVLDRDAFIVVTETADILGAGFRQKTDPI